MALNQGNKVKSADSNREGTHTQLIIVRHAAVLQKGLCYGRHDPVTQECGDALPRLAKQIKEQAGSRPIRQIRSSPAFRCTKIAQPLADLMGIDTKIDEHLCEMHMGDWEAKPYSDLQKRAEFQHWMQNWKEEKPPGGESLSDLENRVRSWLRQLPQNQCVLALSHAGVIRTLRVILMGEEWEEAMRKGVEHVTPYTFFFQARAPFLKTESHTPDSALQKKNH